MDTNSRNLHNLVLTGFMGTGKTTVGIIVAEKLQRPFYDMDAAIVHRTGFTIPRIFAMKGEPFFRAIERGLVHELSLKQGLVISTGGGALIQDDNLNIMQQGGMVICLTADEATIQSRLIGSENRPLASNWRLLWEKRQAQYAQIPHQINTSGKLPETLAQEIIALWRTISM